MALVIEKILSGDLKGYHDFVDTTADVYYGIAATNDLIEANISELWSDNAQFPVIDGKASERGYETEVIRILSTIEVTIGEGK